MRIRSCVPWLIAKENKGHSFMFRPRSGFATSLLGLAKIDQTLFVICQGKLWRPCWAPSIMSWPQTHSRPTTTGTLVDLFKKKKRFCQPGYRTQDKLSFISQSVSRTARCKCVPPSTPTYPSSYRTQISRDRHSSLLTLSKCLCGVINCHVKSLLQGARAL